MFDGILPIWKEAGMTSHDVVFKLRKILGMKKIGHTGTLDPDVEGVLLICLGKATKLVEFLMDGEKVYQGGICLGISTETEDASGDIVEQVAVSAEITEKKIDQMMTTMIGHIQQIPPYYSAVKVQGKKLYEYARQGIEVERPIRHATIKEFRRISQLRHNTDQETVEWDFYVRCSKGTYVRTLAVDLGVKLGYPAHMSHLQRMETGGFSKLETLTLEEVKNSMDKGILNDKIYSVDDVTLGIPFLHINEYQYEEIRYGKLLPKNYFSIEPDPYLAVYYQDKLIGIYQVHPEKQHFIKPKKMIM